jgi:hypothetical protein
MGLIGLAKFCVFAIIEDHRDGIVVIPFDRCHDLKMIFSIKKDAAHRHRALFN